MSPLVVCWTKTRAMRHPPRRHGNCNAFDASATKWKTHLSARESSTCWWTSTETPVQPGSCWPNYNAMFLYCRPIMYMSTLSRNLQHKSRDGCEGCTSKMLVENGVLGVFKGGRVLNRTRINCGKGEIRNSSQETWTQNQNHYRISPFFSF